MRRADASKTDFRAAAEANGRNPAIAAAFVSADADLPAVGVKAGDSLTLTAKQAQSVGYADVVASYDADVLAKMGPGLASAQTVPVDLDPWTAAALWITQPWATILLLALGLALVIIEMLTLHSWGLAGIVGRRSGRPDLRRLYHGRARRPGSAILCSSPGPRCCCWKRIFCRAMACPRWPG